MTDHNECPSVGFKRIDENIDADQIEVIGRFIEQHDRVSRKTKRHQIGLDLSRRPQWHQVLQAGSVSPRDQQRCVIWLGKGDVREHDGSSVYR
ncbi:hypothetical protein GCM10022249_08440 [Enteractinococcus coprophilus]